MKSFSDVSAIRVAGGYLLMVRVPPLSVPRCTSLTPPSPLTHCALPAGLRLRHHAAVGLLQVPRGRGPGRGPACGSLRGLRPGALLTAGHLLQCSHHPGMCWGKSRVPRGWWDPGVCGVARSPPGRWPCPPTDAGCSLAGPALPGPRHRCGRHVPLGSRLHRDQPAHPLQGERRALPRGSPAPFCLPVGPLVTPSLCPHRSGRASA